MECPAGMDVINKQLTIISCSISLLQYKLVALGWWIVNQKWPRQR